MNCLMDCILYQIFKIILSISKKDMEKILINHQYKSTRVLYTFVPNKPFDSLLEISTTNHILLKTFNSEYDKIILWFTDQNSQPLEVKDKVNLTMVVK